MNRAAVVVAALSAQRLLELRVAHRHDAALRARGAIEAGAGHYPVIVGLHAAWLASTLVEGRRATHFRPLPLALLATAQAGRRWAIRSLGLQWTTRVLVDPSAAPVRTGPYRYFAHPNYLAVAAEIAAAPLAVGAPRTALWASLANAVVLRHRIRTETALRRQLARG